MRILLLADIHIGSIKDSEYVYNVITEIIDEEIIFKHSDAIIILGDYFDRLFKVNEDHVATAINVMSYLVDACKRNKTKIRIVYGTESHEMNQYRLFNYHLMSDSIDMKVIETATAEELFPGVNVLYVPEEYVLDQVEHYSKFFSSKYQYIFGHGTIVDGMPSNIVFDTRKNGEKHTAKFKSGEFAPIADITVFGHYHCHTRMPGNVYYLGSLFRASFGEEDDKGYGIIEDGKFQFIKNKRAYVYKTYEFDATSSVFEDPENVVNEIKRIKRENANLFDGTDSGKIRLVFNAPTNLDPAFKDSLKDILLEDKMITPLIKENNDAILEEVKSEIDEQYAFLLDPSLPLVDKIHRYMILKHDSDIPIAKLKGYIE